MSEETEEQSAPVGVVVRCSPALTGAQRRHLRSLGHHLKPVVQIGDKGLHEAVVKQIARALLDHELIKVKARGASAQVRAEMAEAIHKATGAQIVQLLGQVILVYAAHPDKPRITLPRSSP